MSTEYNNQGRVFGKARASQRGLIHALEQHFATTTLLYLDEKIINHLLDSLTLESFFKNFIDHFNDFSFLTAPAYKALEGYLFQIAKELNLPSAGKTELVGNYYFDETKIDKHIDSLLKEIEVKTESTGQLTKYEKQDIKSRIKEMKDYLKHYRHSPAHFMGEPIDTLEKAERNIRIIFGAIDNTTSILLKAKLIKNL